MTEEGDAVGRMTHVWGGTGVGDEEVAGVGEGVAELEYGIETVSFTVGEIETGEEEEEEEGDAHGG